MNAYEQTIQDNLRRLYRNLPENLEQLLLARRQGDKFLLEAFGERCIIESEAITIGGSKNNGALGILISLCALHAKPDACIDYHIY